MEQIISDYGYIAFLIVFIVEYLIANSKLKANSTIDMIINIIKFIFQIKDEEK